MTQALRGQALLDDMRRRGAEESEAHRREAVFLVEADDFAQHHLWLDWSDEAAKRGWGPDGHPRVVWEQIMLGYGDTIGHVGDAPVCVTITFARLFGQVIVFYEATSQVVDHRMVADWLTTAFPASRGHTNATNFHICVQDIKDARKKSSVVADAAPPLRPIRGETTER